MEREMVNSSSHSWRTEHKSVEEHRTRSLIGHIIVFIATATEKSMVFNSLIVLSVAHLSADASQCIARSPDRLTSHQLLYVLFSYPLQQLSRLALSIWTFLCVPPPGSFYYYYYSSDYDSSSEWILSLVISPSFLQLWDCAILTIHSSISASGFLFFFPFFLTIRLCVIRLHNIRFDIFWA